MSFKLTVIICTHNPRKEFLDRTLQALQSQTLPKQAWEFLLIDNASDTLVAGRWDIGWHPNAAHLHEPRLGLTFARLTGIAAAKAPWLVFVDDDNLLAPDYLENACKIAESKPFLGVFSGKIIGEFEAPPPEWLVPDLGMIAVRDLQKDMYSNFYTWDASPVGAGMVIRKEIATAYMEDSLVHPIKKMLGRSGKNLSSGEDTDMILTALDRGFAIGRFTNLELIHLIPKSRLEKTYILQLCEGVAYSNHILGHIWKEKSFFTPRWHYQVALQLYRLLFVSFYEFQKENAKIRGSKQAARLISGMDLSVYKKN